MSSPLLCIVGMTTPGSQCWNCCKGVTSGTVTDKPIDASVVSSVFDRFAPSAVPVVVDLSHTHRIEASTRWQEKRRIKGFRLGQSLSIGFPGSPHPCSATAY